MKLYLNEIELVSGNAFDVLHPKKEQVDIIDIAHALSQLCRFNGHCKKFYSVAQHSVICARTAISEYDLKNSDDNTNLRLWCLLHDSAEAYIGDLVRPVKKLPGMEKFSEIESKIMDVISDRFDLSKTMPDEVKTIDNRVLFTEKRDIMESSSDWQWKTDYIRETIVPWDSEKSRCEFLKMWVSINNGK